MSLTLINSGEKWISTVWMREGVDEVNDWTKFDPNGNAILDDASYATDTSEVEGSGDEESVQGDSADNKIQEVIVDDNGFDAEL